MKRTKVAFNHEKLQVSSEIMRALAHPLRLKILEFIDQHKKINVNRIYNNLKIEQSITSQHLKILRFAGIVNAERKGKYIHYTIDYDKIENASQALRNFKNL